MGRNRSAATTSAKRSTYAATAWPQSRTPVRMPMHSDGRGGRSRRPISTTGLTRPAPSERTYDAPLSASAQRPPQVFSAQTLADQLAYREFKKVARAFRVWAAAMLVRAPARLDAATTLAFPPLLVRAVPLPCPVFFQSRSAFSQAAREREQARGRAIRQWVRALRFWSAAASSVRCWFRFPAELQRRRELAMVLYPQAPRASR